MAGGQQGTQRQGGLKRHGSLPSHQKKQHIQMTHLSGLAPKQSQLNAAVDDANCDLSCTQQPPASPQVQTIYRDYRRSSEQVNQTSLHFTEVFRDGNRLKDRVTVTEHCDFPL